MWWIKWGLMLMKLVKMAKLIKKVRDWWKRRKENDEDQKGSVD